MKIPYGDQGLYILETAGWRSHKPVILKERCINCGICAVYCPVNAFYKDGKEILVSLDYCKGCGICCEECPKDAISWEKEDNKA